MKIYIWGTGDRAQKYLKTSEINANELCGFIKTVRGEEDFFMGAKVYEPHEIAGLEYDFILVLVEAYTHEIRQTAQKEGINLDKLVFYDTVEWIDGGIVRYDDMMRTSVRTIPCASNESVIAEQFPLLYTWIQEKRFYARSIISTYRNAKDDIDDSVIVMNDGFDSRIYSDDYFRYRTFELVADEIIKNDIEGVCAEVGVFRGDFARLINVKLNKKKLYLFDTFDGFNKKEIEKEIIAGKAPLGCENDFDETSVKIVIKNMLYPENCIIRKGYFPSTVNGSLENERYCFVSIDVDLEDSILESLRYFYPRLVNDGYIFVHDYNNRKYFGVKSAVECYEKEVGIILKKIPIADQGGTLIIVK